MDVTEVLGSIGSLGAQSATMTVLKTVFYDSLGLGNAWWFTFRVSIRLHQRVEEKALSFTFGVGSLGFRFGTWSTVT